jgi:predicted RND superfamily exporter protein
MLKQLFVRRAFLIILVFVFVLPIMTRGARKALRSNDNNVQDWLPKEYEETQDFAWFRDHFDNETFVLVTWKGCTIDDPRLELFERKIIPNPHDLPADARFKHLESTKTVVERLISPPLNLSEEEANNRLRGMFVGPDNKQACCVLTLTEFGKQDLRATLDRIYHVCEQEMGLPHERVKLGGPPVDNVAISTEGERTLMRLFIPAGIVGISLAYWCLRSVRLTTMVFGTGIYAAAVCLAMVWYSGNSMNAILLTLPAVVYVAGVSGAIHFANYYRDAVIEDGVENAPASAVKHAWLACGLSAGTTAAGLFSLYTSELVPIRMFGLFSALGVLASLALLFLFLPAWMQVWPMKQGSLLDGNAPKKEDLGLPQRWRNLLGGILDHHRSVLAGLLLLMMFCGYGLTQINTSIKLTKLFSSGAEIIQNYGWLEENLGPLVPMEVVVKIDNSKSQTTFLERLELIDRIQHRMESINGIGNTMSLVTYAPSLVIKRAGPFISKNTMRNILNKKLEDHREEYLQSDFLAVDGDVELYRITARVGALNDIDYGEFKNDIQNAVEPVLAEERLRLASVAEKGTRRAKRPAKGEVRAASFEIAHIALAEADIAAESPAITAPAELPPETDATDAALGPQASNDYGMNAVYTGLVPVVYKAQRSMLNGLAWNFLTDLLTISVVMMIVFRDAAAGLILLIPSVFPLVIVFGLMGWCGVLIDVGTIMTPTVALGVSVDDVVHFLIWYRRGLSEGRSRRDAVMLAYEGCARAMYQSWSVLGLGLAVFALSTFVPTQRFGAMMFLLLTCALVGNMVLLPVILRGPMGALFLWKLRRDVARHPEKYPIGETFPNDLDPPQPLSHIHVDRPHDHVEPKHRRPPALPLEAETSEKPTN